MRFVDEVVITVQSGRGGNGCSSFRKEKFVPFGGPDGGDGGRGGDVRFVADEGMNTLLGLRRRALWRAKNGRPGGTRRRTGGCANHVEIRVPPGTAVHDAETGDLLFELLAPGAMAVAAPGGSGGLGNIHFKTSTNRTPRKCTEGDPAVRMVLRVELKLMADVGLLGFPNAGKSTLISRLSAARPRVADYPFTTLEPQLGVVEAGDHESFVMADIPGLIEGAAEGRGLGLLFLRHVSRTRALLHLVSAQDEGQGDAGERYRIIRGELAAYDTALSDRPELVAVTKADAVSEEDLAKAVADVEAACGEPVFVISSVSGQGLDRLRERVWRMVCEAPRDLDAPLDELPVEPGGPDPARGE